METRKLEHFIELAITGSFSRAASNLHLTQSALSKSIQSLEAELGIQLIERMGRRCTTTTAGSMMLERARNLVFEVDNLVNGASENSDIEGTLRVGFGAGPGACMASSLVTHVLHDYPKIQLLLRRGTVQFLMSALRDRSIDMVLIDTRSLTLSGDLIVEDVGALESGIVCRVGHPLALRPSIGVRDLLQYPILSTAVSDEVARLTEAHFNLQRDIRSWTVVESEELEPLIAAVARSDAIFFGVTAAAKVLIAAGKLQTLSIENSMNLSIPVSIVRLSSKGDSRLFDIVKEFASNWLRTSNSSLMAGA